MDVGGRGGVPVDEVAPAGVGPAWSHIPSTAVMSPLALFPPEVSVVSGLRGGDIDTLPSAMPRDGSADRTLLAADDWLPWVLDSGYHAAGVGPHPPQPFPTPLSPLPPPPPPQTHPPTHPPWAVSTANVGGRGGGHEVGRVPAASAAAVTDAMPVDGAAAVDAAMAAAKAVLADVTAPAVEPLTAPSTPRSVNRAGGSPSSRLMDWGVAALTIGKRPAATAAAGARGGRPRPMDAANRREDSSSSGGSGDCSSGLSAGDDGGAGGACGSSNYDPIDGDGDEGKGNPLVAHLAAALTDIPSTTPAAATRCKALACLATIRAAAPDGGIGLPPVPTTAEREALRIVLNRRSADRSRQRRRRQTTAVAAAVADKEATIAVLQREVARLIAHVTALQEQLEARQGEDGHPAEAA